MSPPGSFRGNYPHAQSRNGHNEAVDFADRIRELALSLPQTYEDEPWGHPVFKVADNRMFASMSEEGAR